jgi:hypothetical protein
VQQREQFEGNENSSRRHPEDSLRVRAWYRVVAFRAGAATWEALRTMFPTEPKRRDPRDVDESKRWRNYERGTHVPNDELVDRVEAEYPGTKAILNHPTWRLLTRYYTTGAAAYDEIVDLRRELVVDICPIVETSTGRRRVPRLPTDQQLHSIVGECGLDALAVLLAANHFARWVNDEPCQARTSDYLLSLFAFLTGHEPLRHLQSDLSFVFRTRFLNIAYQTLPRRVLGARRFRAHATAVACLSSMLVEMRLINSVRHAMLAAALAAEARGLREISGEVFRLRHNGAVQPRISDLSPDLQVVIDAAGKARHWPANAASDLLPCEMRSISMEDIVARDLLHAHRKRRWSARRPTKAIQNRDQPRMGRAVRSSQNGAQRFQESAAADSDDPEQEF